MRYIIATFAVLCVASCASAPKVVLWNKHRRRPGSQYKIRTRWLDHHAKNDGQQTKRRLRDHSDFGYGRERFLRTVYTINPRSNLFFTTTITKSVFLPNTKILQALGTKVEDQRTELISQASKIVSLLALDDPKARRRQIMQSIRAAGSKATSMHLK